MLTYDYFCNCSKRPMTGCKCSRKYIICILNNTTCHIYSDLTFNQSINNFKIRNHVLLTYEIYFLTFRKENSLHVIGKWRLNFSFDLAAPITLYRLFQVLFEGKPNQFSGLVTLCGSLLQTKDYGFLHLTMYISCPALWNQSSCSIQNEEKLLKEII